MRRRDFTIGLLCAARGVSALAEQPATPLIGFLFPGSPGNAAAEAYVTAFRKGLAADGYFEEQNVAFACHSGPRWISSGRRAATSKGDRMMVNGNYNGWRLEDAWLDK